MKDVSVSVPMAEGKAPQDLDRVVLIEMNTGQKIKMNWGDTTDIQDHTGNTLASVSVIPRDKADVLWSQEEGN